MSTTRFKSAEISFVGQLILKVLSLLRLVDLKKVIGEDGEYLECNNLTIINLFLHFGGPTHEKDLTNRIIFFQVYLYFMLLRTLFKQIFSLLLKTFLFPIDWMQHRGPVDKVPSRSALLWIMMMIQVKNSVESNSSAMSCRFKLWSACGFEISDFLGGLGWNSHRGWCQCSCAIKYWTIIGNCN